MRLSSMQKDFSGHVCCVYVCLNTIFRRSVGVICEWTEMEWILILKKVFKRKRADI